MIAARSLARPLAQSASARLLLKQQSSPFHSTRVLAKPRRPRRTGEPGKGLRKNQAVDSDRSAGAPKKWTGDSQDAHKMAQDRIMASSDIRIPGTEAIASLTPEQRIRNFAMALTLVGFATGIWWYSIQAVGKSETGVDQLRAEAQEARGEAERKSSQQREAEELAELEVTMANLEQSEGGELIDAGADITVAVAAPDAIAREEEELNLAARNKAGGGSGKPLWKKIVFFWRKE